MNLINTHQATNFNNYYNIEDYYSFLRNKNLTTNNLNIRESKNDENQPPFSKKQNRKKRKLISNSSSNSQPLKSKVVKMDSEDDILNVLIKSNPTNLTYVPKLQLYWHLAQNPSLLSHIKIAHVWSLRGKMKFKTINYPLETMPCYYSTGFFKEQYHSWIKYVKNNQLKNVKNISNALEIFNQTFINSINWNELCNHNTLLEYERHIKIADLAKSGNLWIYPINLQYENTKNISHVVSLAGNSKLVILYNREKICYKVKDKKQLFSFPPSIAFYKPTCPVDLNIIYSHYARYATQIDVDQFFNYLKKMKLIPICRFELGPQKVANCCFISSEGAMQSAMILEQMTKMSGEITSKSITQAIVKTLPAYKDWAAFSRWDMYERNKPFANLAFIRSVETKIILKLVNQVLNKNVQIFKDNEELRQICGTLLPFKAHQWSPTKKDALTYLSINEVENRDAMIKAIYKLNISEINAALETFVRERNLTTITLK